MDDEAIAALGLSLPSSAAGPGTDVGGSGNRGGAATSAMAASVDGTDGDPFRTGVGTHGSAATSAMPTWWEAQLRGFLRMAGSEGAEGEDPAAQLRGKLLLGTMRAMSPAERFTLRSRLEDPLPDDELARLFAQQLGRSSRERLLAVLRGLPADPSARSEGGEAPNAEAPRAEGGDAMWRHVVGEASTAVGVFGRVSAPRGVRLRTRPAAGAPELGILPFDALVSVERRTEHGWCWVVPTEGSAPGFCEEPFLALDPPEPTAHLHRVEPGASLRTIAARYYGEQFHGGRDARLYVQALYEANKGRKGVYLTEVELGRATTFHRSEAEERTLEIFQGVKVRKGHALWVPSEGFIEQLRARGAISSGSSEISQAWRGAKAAVGAAVDAASYGAAFTVGLLEGAWGAVVELFQGAADMIELVAKTVFQLVTGELGAIKATLLGWVEKLAGAWASRDKIADAFMQKWEAEDGWERGNFQGEVLGWVMMTALLIFATAGQGAVAMATGKWASVLRALRAVDALGDVTTYVGKAARLPGKAAALVRRRVGKGLEEGVEGLEEGVEEGLDESNGLARGITRADGPEGGARRGDKGAKPKMETETVSLDGHEFHNDFRKLSGTARHVIRQLEARGWVRVSEILPSDLVEISKWFGKEIGVVQTPRGNLRVILGTEDGILLKQINDGELFLAHTHPVVTTVKDHFDLDLPNAGRHVEAVIDWSGQVTYFSRAGIKNPVTPGGYVEPLLNYRAAFLNESGAIVGLADVDIIEVAGGTAVRMRK